MKRSDLLKIHGIIAMFNCIPDYQDQKFRGSTEAYDLNNLITGGNEPLTLRPDVQIDENELGWLVVHDGTPYHTRDEINENNFLNGPWEQERDNGQHN